MNSRVESQLNFIKKNSALFMVYQIGRDEEEEGENEIFTWLTNFLFITCSLTPRRCVMPTLKATLQEVISAHCVESNQEHQHPE